MAFSFYFNTSFQGCSKRTWKLLKTDEKEWIVEEELAFYPSTSSSTSGQKITLQSEEQNKYCAVLEITELNNSRSSKYIVKHQDLSKSNIIQILPRECANIAINQLRCHITLFPCYSLENIGGNIPLKQTDATETRIKQITEKKFDRLSNDMLSLLENGMLSDVLLVSGEFQLKAHKNILSARSEVFAKMFSLPMKENLENKVTISDITGPILEEMVSYIYTGIVTFKDTSTVHDLYIAADKYELGELKALCSSWLMNMTLDSVLDALLLAEIYDDNELKNEAKKFISKNYSSLKSRETWNSFLKEYPSLAVEVLQYAVEAPKA